MIQFIGEIPTFKIPKRKPKKNMKVSEKFVSNENGTEYFKIFFEILNDSDISFEEHKEIQSLIYEKLQSFKEEKTKRIIKNFLKKY